MSGNHDLRQLTIEREPAASRHPAHRRHLVTRYIFPAGVFVGFALLLSWALRDRFVPTTPVTVVPVVVTRAEVHQSGAPLFQAPGWVEPRPTAIFASALAEGVIEQLLVVEGQEVNAGEPIARLIDADARIALERAEADLQLRQAELASAQAEVIAAQARREEPVHLQAALAEADSQLVQTEMELAKLPYQVQAAEAQVDFANQALSSKRSARGAVAGVYIQQAESEREQAVFRLEELRQQAPRLERQIEALERKRDALATQLQRLVDESKQLAEAKAKVNASEARKRLALADVEAAQLRLERMVIRAPSSGRVLDLLASPGTRVAGWNSETPRGGSAVASLYDPQMLQVRVDVRLEDVPLVQSGQPVTIETASSAKPLLGEVLLPTSQANVQKNTLEVKVAIHDPPPTVRPEMLVKATFLEPEQPTNTSDESRPEERLLVPRLLVGGEDDGAFVWLASPAGRARRQAVKLGSAVAGELIEVVQGLTPTDKIIVGGRETLADGDRIRITGEDPSLGVSPMAQN